MHVSVKNVCNVMSIKIILKKILKLQHPPVQPPGHLNFGRLACSNSLPSGQTSRLYAPPISTEIPLLKDKFRLQSIITVLTFQRGICRNDTFKLLFKTLLREVFITKAKFYLGNPLNPAKTEKTHG